MFHLSGTAEPYAEIFIRNLDTTVWTSPAQQSAGTLADPQGKWQKDVFALRHDYMTIDQDHGDVLSYEIP